MYNKYADPKIPILSDGDFLGIFVETEETLSTIEFLITEGAQRQENVFVINWANSTTNIFFPKIESKHNYIEADSSFSFFEFLKKERLAAINSGYTGIRVICLENSINEPSIFKNPKFSHEILIFLMEGSVSIGRIIDWNTGGNLDNIIFHPRLLIEGEAIPNPCFIPPPELKDHKSAFKIFLKDHTERMKLADYKLSRFPTNLNSLLESILESVKIGLVVGDRYGNMVLFNKEAQRIMKIKPSPLPYAERIRRFGNFLPDTTTPYPFDSLPLSRAVKGEQFAGESVYIKTNDMESGIWCESSGSGVRDADGNLVGGVVVFHDVTEIEVVKKEKEKLENRLLQSQKLESLGLLAGGIAHDFNNLLLGILGNAEILMKNQTISRVGEKHIGRIEQAVLELSGLTKQLLIYSGLSPSKDHSAVSLPDLVCSMYGLLKSGVSKKVNLEFDVANDNIVVLIDEVQIRQVLLNLVMNSSDACKESLGTIKVLVRKEFLNSNDTDKLLFSENSLEGFYAVFEVRDTGSGMTLEVINKIFDPFYSSKGSGRGLGLSAVVGIIKNHKGMLDVSSEVGKGSSFKVYLPLLEIQEDSTSVNKKNILTDDTVKQILVIDDESIILEVSEALLSSEGYNIVSEMSGLKGLDYLKNNIKKISCLLVDLTLPDISGLRIYEELRLFNKNLPVIITSGFSKDLSNIDFSVDSNLYFLEKPYRGEALVSLVNSLLLKSAP